MIPPFDSIHLLSMDVASCSSGELLDHLFRSLEAGEGGWIVTANLDILRRFELDEQARAAYAAADLRVADGMPLVWASKLRGRPLPERIAGSTLTLELAERAAREGRSIYLLGGDPGAADACAAELCGRFEGLEITGCSSPFVAAPPSEEEVQATLEELRAAPSDIVLVGLGSPKQEYLIERLRAEMPGVWFMGVGITFSFVAGQVQRAPKWMQDSGLEWVHRMVQDPKRLFQRYIIDDLPFAARLFSDALLRRIR